MGATKGKSNLYGNPAGMPTENIGFAYAKCFNHSTLIKHYNEHGADVGASSAREYEQLAIDFANDVDNVLHDSFIDDNGSTHKYSYETHEFVIVREDGTIVTYFIPDSGDSYWENDRRRHEK